MYNVRSYIVYVTSGKRTVRLRLLQELYERFPIRNLIRQLQLHRRDCTGEGPSPSILSLCLYIAADCRTCVQLCTTVRTVYSTFVRRHTCVQQRTCMRLHAYLCVAAKECIAIKNTKQNLLVFIPPTFPLESRNKNYRAPIGTMRNYLLSAESFM